MRKINTTVDSGLMRFSITDIDGDEIGWFRLNPTDVRLMSRAKEISKFFEQHKIGADPAEEEIQEQHKIGADPAEEEIQEQHKIGADPAETEEIQEQHKIGADPAETEEILEQHKIGADPAETEEILEQKICDLLGYDARKDLFGILSATTVMPNGEMFLLTILDAIHDAIKPELEARGKKMRERMNQYTDKYDTVQPS